MVTGSCIGCKEKDRQTKRVSGCAQSHLDIARAARLARLTPHLSHLGVPRSTYLAPPVLGAKEKLGKRGRAM